MVRPTLTPPSRLRGTGDIRSRTERMVRELQNALTNALADIETLSLVARVTGEAQQTTAQAIATVATNILAVTIDIPAEWNTYKLRASGTCQLVDSSGATTGATLVTGQFVLNGSNFGASLGAEVEGQNNHDNHPFAQQAFTTGLTEGIGSNRTITWQMTRAAVNTTDADQITLFVEAIRTS